MPATPDHDLLQVVEHTLEALKRTGDVLRRALDAMERGERFDDAAIAEYRDQLIRVEGDRQRAEALLRLLWSQVERQ